MAQQADWPLTPRSPHGRLLGRWITLWRARLCKLPVWLLEAGRTAWAGRDAAHACTSLAMTRSTHLAVVLGSRPTFHSRLLPLRATTIVGWGRRWSGLRAVRIAARTGRPFCLVEDGFLRSVGRSDASLSHVMDRRGIYYDATRGSSFEDLASHPLTAEERQRAQEVARMWRDFGVSKYNAYPDPPPIDQPFVLVVDQTCGDASVSFGQANAQSFHTMLATALQENPDHLVVVKTHPDTHVRKAKGHFDLDLLQRDSRIRVICDPCHPVPLIAQARTVYTVTSQIGFEALIWNRPVRTFGMPFYAGWGLTEDTLSAPARRRPVSLEQLVHAALVAYPRYVDPLRQQRCEVEDTLAHVALQRRHRAALPPIVNTPGFSRWKRPFVAAFLQGSQVDFRSRDRACGAVALWGSSPAPALLSGTSTLRIEDGFLRSSGLGADLVKPLSLVIDDLGIYYDATRPSRLEQILARTTLGASDRHRAQALREKLIALDVTKYNLGQASWDRPLTERVVLLVIGQVETDASIRFGSPEIVSNIALLRRVRAENPQAYIVYKPHPDVLAGLRQPGATEDSARLIADETLKTQVSLNRLLSGIDAVHTMTSLLGFEALIRGKLVVCHGLPFYAGWGLTEDRLACSRRTRQLSIDDLVHATLIAYPRYLDHDHRCFIEPEQAVDLLFEKSMAGPVHRRWHRRLLRAGLVTWRRLAGSR